MGKRVAVLRLVRIGEHPQRFPQRFGPVPIHESRKLEGPARTGLSPYGPAWIRTRDQRIMSPLL